VRWLHLQVLLVVPYRSAGYSIANSICRLMTRPKSGDSVKHQKKYVSAHPPARTVIPPTNANLNRNGNPGQRQSGGSSTATSSMYCNRTPAVAVAASTHPTTSYTAQ